MKQKIFWLLILLSFLVFPLHLITQDLAQELQKLTLMLQDLTTFLMPPTKPTEPDKPTEPTKPDQPEQPIIPEEPEQPTGALIPFTTAPDFTAWKNGCDKLTKYDDAKRKNPPNNTVLTFELFKTTLDAYFAAAKPTLENAANWYREKMPDPSEAWDSDPIPDSIINSPKQWVTYHPLFVPFVEKHTFKTTDITAFHGDFHGDIHAFNNFIDTWVKAGHMDNDFKIIKDNFYIMFLGDYTDRGWYGAEIIYALLRVKLANPTQVFIVRGNHEDLNIIAEHGFTGELYRKFEEKEGDILLNQINRFYNFLPMAIYLICPSISGKHDVIQCCHGGIEIGYNPTRFLPSKAQFAYIPLFMRANGYNYIKDKAPGFTDSMQNDVPAAADNGFMWSDFIVTSTTEKLELSGRGEGLFTFGKTETETLLKNWSTPQYALRAIFRAHQHIASDEDPMKQVILNFNKTRNQERIPDLFPDDPFSPLNATWYNTPEQDSGIAFLWSDSAKETGSLKNILALTFSVAPGTPYDWPYDAFGLLTLAEGYDNWNMKVYRAYRNKYEKGEK